ncbi:ABC transporter permease [Paenibacillus ihuae]|uniref:ABC transporter permease n=1 Tax=Paenibacillus ihuae TaxID=1232431 RepID=UPI0006D57B3D|nr:ABC-2 family transporter protein [Paenibacillus ihuae]
MKKYVQVMKLNLQTSFAYKGNFMLSSLMDVFRVVAEIAFWGVLFDNLPGSELSGYQFNSIVSYYIAMFIISSFTNVGSTGYKVANDIKDGVLNNLLVRPIHYIGYCFTETVSQKLLNLIIAMLMFIPVIVFRFGDLDAGMTLEQLGWFPVVILGSLILSFFINILVSLFVFWMTEVTSLFFLKDIILDLASGRVFPLDLFPKTLLNAFSVLPFMYCTYFPAVMITKGWSAAELYRGLGIQLVWILGLYGLIQIFWRLGLKKYTGTGA